MLKGKVIVVAEDEDMIREFIVDSLKDLGAEVLEASNGIEALNLCTNFNVHLVLSDGRMPGGNGFEFLQNLKSYKQEAMIPFIFVTGFTDFPMDVAKDLGVVKIFPKPFVLKELLESVTDNLSVKA